MFTKYVLRGMKAGGVAGIAFGLFVALIGNPLIRYGETFEESHHGGGPVVSGDVTTVVSIVGGVLLGILLGAVFLGVAFYFLEPAIPGEGGTKSYLLAAAGFVTVSGAPWLVLPPQPPGIEQTLAIGTRLMVYAGMMLAGAIACGLSGYVFNRLHTQYGRIIAFIGALAPLGLLFVVAAISPSNSVSGPIPDQIAAIFRVVMAMGQVSLWLVLASVHAWLLERERANDATHDDRTTYTDTSRAVTSD